MVSLNPTELSALDDSISLSEGFALECLEEVERAEKLLASLTADPANTAIRTELAELFHRIKTSAETLELSSLARLAQKAHLVFASMGTKESYLTSDLIGLQRQILMRLQAYSHRLLKQVGPKENQTSMYKMAVCDMDVDPTLEKRLDRDYRRLRFGISDEEPRLGDLLIDQGILSRMDLEQALELQGQPLGALIIALGMADTDQIDSALRLQGKGRPPSASLRVDSSTLLRLNRTILQILIGATTYGAPSPIPCMRREVYGELAEEHRETQSSALQPSVPRRASPDGFSVIEDSSRTLRTSSDSAKTPTDSTAFDRESNGQLRQTLRSLWLEVAELMVCPMRDIFQRVRVHTRNLSLREGRKFELNFHGDMLTVDLDMMEVLSSALSQAVRNAVEHGMESHRLRSMRRKPLLGAIQVSAYQSNHDLILTVRDDGNGINFDRFSNIMRNCSVREIPVNGREPVWCIEFQTKPEENQVSETPVPCRGLDDISRAVRTLQGTCWIETQLGMGTCLFMKLTPHRRFFDAILVKVSGELYLVQSSRIREYVRPIRSQCMSEGGRATMFNVRGKWIPLLWPPTKNIDAPNTNLWEAVIVVLERKGEIFGVVADEVLGEHRLPTYEEGVDPQCASHQHHVLDDGRIAYLI